MHICHFVLVRFFICDCNSAETVFKYIIREREYKDFREQVAIGRKPKGRSQDMNTARHKRGGAVMSPAEKRVSRASSSSSSSGGLCVFLKQYRE
jgi:hypothetical protein